MPWKPDYLTLGVAKHFERIGDELDDSELAVYISTASRAIDDTCNRQFGQLDTAAEWTYRPYYDIERGRWACRVDDITDTTGLIVKVGGTTLAAGTYALEPSRAASQGRSYTRVVIGLDAAAQPAGNGTEEAAITCRWGWSTQPAQVGMACRLQVSRFAARRESPYGIAGSPDTGGELRLLARVDPDVAVSLRGLVRPRMAA